ncbi:MAG: GC-type dockerin domain-anchored protein [Phycisphaerales bacterium]
MAGPSTGQIGPDVIVAELTGPSLWGQIGGVSAYSLGTTSCNLGDEDLLWDDETNDGTPGNLHPVIAQNMFRLKDGRFEQIGMSWLKHGFFALNQNGLCGFPCDPAPGFGTALGPGCSDPYSSGLNGSQTGLGARFEINAATGEYPWPFTGDGTSGNSLFKRIQVQNTDLDPSLNAGAIYFGEGHYVTPDDAAAGNDNNNASYREMRVNSLGSNGWSMSYVGGTQRGKPAILAWKDYDPTVETVPVDVEGDGRFWVAYQVTDNGDGTWRYEYAVHNLSSDRSGGSLTIPVGSGVTVTNAGFKDIDYHSGEPWDNTDWSVSVGSDEIVWASPQTFAQNPNSNALRWGTLYNFWFTADSAPEEAQISLGLFKPGPGTEIKINGLVPTAIAGCLADVNGNGELDPGDFTAWTVAYSANDPAADQNEDGIIDPSDFNAWLVNYNNGC